jgi:hemerythrin
MIDLNSIPQVAYEEMNLVHNEEATLLNNLETTIDEDGQNVEKIANILHELIEHTRGHFANEVRLMKEVGFPALHMHEGEHIKVFNEMQMVFSNWLSVKDNELLKEYFLGSMTEWLKMHIQTMDTITAQFIAMNKS